MGRVIFVLRCNKFGIGQPLVGYGINKTFKTEQSMPLAVPGVQPKGELIDISPQVLRAGMMIDPVKTTLQGGPHAVNIVR